MGKKSAPPPPDYTAAAEKTAQSSKEAQNLATWANRPDQVNPWGSQTWQASKTIDPSTGQPVTKWTQNTSLDPSLQNALDSQLQLQQGRSDLANSLWPRAQNEFGQAMDWSGLPSWAQTPQAPTSAAGSVQTGLNFGNLQGVGDAASTRQKAEDALYASATSRLDPQWAQQQKDLETSLANRGISVNSDAYRNALDNFNRQKTDAYSSARNQAVTGAGAEAQRDYQMDLGLRQQQANEALQQGNFGNAAQNQQFAQQGQLYNQQMQQAQFQNQQRQQQLAEEMQKRGFSLNEINAIISGQQVGMPQFGGFSQAQAGQSADYLGATQAGYQAQLNSYNANQQGLGNLISGAAGIAGMFFSDARTKQIIRRIGKHERGFGLYEFRYIGESGTRVGPIAQEVKHFAPEWVKDNGGLLMVDYKAAGLLEDKQ